MAKQCSKCGQRIVVDAWPDHQEAHAELWLERQRKRRKHHAPGGREE